MAVYLADGYVIDFYGLFLRLRAADTVGFLRSHGRPAEVNGLTGCADNSALGPVCAMLYDGRMMGWTRGSQHGRIRAPFFVAAK